MDVLLATSGDLQFEVGEDPLARVQLTANCGFGLLNGALPDAEGSVTCEADPLVGFDQVAFDAQFGSQSFPLADYFGFVFSDGLAPQPPTPNLPRSLCWESASPGSVSRVAEGDLIREALRARIPPALPLPQSRTASPVKDIRS